MHVTWEPTQADPDSELSSFQEQMGFLHNNGEMVVKALVEATTLH